MNKLDYCFHTYIYDFIFNKICPICFCFDDAVCFVSNTNSRLKFLSPIIIVYT